MKISGQKPPVVKILLLLAAAAVLIPLTPCGGQASEMNPGSPLHHAFCPFYIGAALFSVFLLFFAFLFIYYPTPNILLNPFIPENPPRAC